MADLKPKRIIICCDGTWQSAVSGEKNEPSNVTRLARNLERITTDKNGEEWQQIVWYDSGVGTTSGFLGRKLEGAVGQGLEGNVIEAYNFCVLNYAPGDQIMVFGFSRGAYTARAIAGLITDIGICRPEGLHNFYEIWQLYKQTPAGTRFNTSDAFFDFVEGVEAEPEDQPNDLGYHNYNKKWTIYPHYDWSLYEESSREIEVVGVYDTVGALGMPSVMGYEAKFLFGPDKLGYHNVRLNPNVKNAFHALAIDEHREAFSPTLWHLPERSVGTKADLDAAQEAEDKAKAAWEAVKQDKGTPKPKRDELKKKYYDLRRATFDVKTSMKPRSNLDQVWFPGVHISIGGGSSDTLEDKGDLEETSNITFSWMLDKISPFVGVDKSAVLNEALKRQRHINYLNYQTKLAEDAAKAEAEKVQKSWGAWIKKGVSSAASTVMHPLTPSPTFNQRVRGWGTGTIIDSFTAMYMLNGSKPRTPGAYTKDKKGLTPGRTNEKIHPTVGYRMFITKDGDKTQRYFPAHSKEGGFKRQKNAKGDGWEYIIEGVADPMPEAKLPISAPGANPTQLPFERFAVLGEDAQKYVAELDAFYGNPQQSNGLPFSDSASYY